VDNLGRDYNPRMVTLSRRRFGSMLVAGVPLAGLTRAIRAASPKLLLGVTSSSFRDFPRVEGQDNLDAVIRALPATQEPREPATNSHRSSRARCL